MKWVGWTSSMVLLAALTGCGGGGEGTASASESASSTDDGATTQGTQSSQATTGGGVSESETQTPTTGGGVSESVSETGESAGDPTSASESVSGTTDGTTTDGTTANVTASESDASTGAPDTTGGLESTSSEGGEESSSGETTDDCVPTPEICDDVDNDCDGAIDDVDVGMDGICDCLNIALIGNQGANPSAEFQSWLEAQGTQVDRISTNANEVLDKATLNKYDIVILDYLIRNYTADEAQTTKTWVEAGGGLMSMTGFADVQSAADRPNSLIKAMGLSYNTSKSFFNGPVTQFVPHPITMGLTSISFYGGLFIDAVADGVGVNQTIMTMAQGPVGVVQERLNGRVFIFGDEWIEFDSEWKNIPQIKQFWVQTLAYLGPKESCQVPQ